MALLTFDNFYTLTRIQKKQLVFLIDEYIPFPKYGENAWDVVKPLTSKGTGKVYLSIGTI